MPETRRIYNPPDVRNHRTPTRQQPRTINGGATRPFIPCERGGIVPVPPAARRGRKVPKRSRWTRV